MEGVDPARRARLMELLDIDPAWRLNRVSDGQRRRVQICMGLLKPYQARAHLIPCARECSTMNDTAGLHGPCEAYQARPSAWVRALAVTSSGWRPRLPAREHLNCVRHCVQI